MPSPLLGGVTSDARARQLGYRGQTSPIFIHSMVDCKHAQGPAGSNAGR